MKATLLLTSLMVLVQVIVASSIKKESFVDHCADKGKVGKEKVNKLDKVDFSEADKQGIKFERESVKKAKTSIPQLGKDLAAPFTDPLLKARTIYTWLHHYVAFDAVPNSTRKSPEEVIIRGIAVSLDIAKLFEELALGAGLDVKYITGHGKGPGYKLPPPGVLPPFEPTHAWNAVKKLDGKWQLIDPSYGARVVKTPEKKYAKRFDPKPFESSPEVFRLSHYPEKPENQFCSDVISWRDYIWPPPPPTTPAPPAKPGFSFWFKNMSFDENELMPNVPILRAGEPIRFVIKTSCKNPPIKKEDRYILFIDDGGELTPLTMEVEGRVWSAVTPQLDPGGVGLVIVSALSGRDTKGWTLEEFEKRKKEGKGMQFQPIVGWKVEEQEEDSSMQGQQVSPAVTQINDSDVWHLTCVDYTEADAQGAKFPREEFKTIRKLARELTSPFTSHILKARALFIWITTNIVYDARTLSQAIMHKSAEKVVRAGMGSCQGFTELFDKLAKAAGLEVMYIVGAPKGPGETPLPEYKINHAWNAVKINGRWRPIDCTWGSGKIIEDGVISGSGFKSHYFTSSPEVFRLEHFPEKPEQQFCSDVITYDQWKLPVDAGNWVADVDVGLNLEEMKPNRRRIPAGKPVRVEVNCKCGPIKPEDQYLFFINASNGVTPLKKGEDGCLYSAVLTPLGGQDMTLVYVTEFGNYSVKGLTMQEFEAPHPGIKKAQRVIARWGVEDPPGTKRATEPTPSPPKPQVMPRRPGEALRIRAGR